MDKSEKPKEIRINTQLGTKKELHLWLLENYEDAPAITNVICALISALKNGAIELIPDPSVEFGFSISHPNPENLMNLVVEEVKDSTKVDVPFNYPKELESEVIAFNSSLMIVLGWVARQGGKEAMEHLINLIEKSNDNNVMEEATEYAASLLGALSI